MGCLKNICLTGDESNIVRSRLISLDMKKICFRRRRELFVISAPRFQQAGESELGSFCGRKASLRTGNCDRGRYKPRAELLWAGLIWFATPSLTCVQDCGLHLFLFPAAKCWCVWIQMWLCPPSPMASIPSNGVHLRFLPLFPGIQNPLPHSVKLLFNNNVKLHKLRSKLFLPISVNDSPVLAVAPGKTQQASLSPCVHCVFYIPQWPLSFPPKSFQLGPLQITSSMVNQPQATVFAPEYHTRPPVMSLFSCFLLGS